jgi:hypothetical protein
VLVALEGVEESLRSFIRVEVRKIGGLRGRTVLVWWPSLSRHNTMTTARYSRHKRRKYEWLSLYTFPLVLLSTYFTPRLIPG